MTPFHKILIYLRRLRYPGAAKYWERRYAQGGTSGSGSTGLLAAYKAALVNQFVSEQGIGSIFELGCGDGAQLQLAQYPHYVGADISAAAIARCEAIFATDPQKKFAVYDPFNFNSADFEADMALSLEVIFHLTEEPIYQLYMQHLFASARRWVLIFSADSDDTTRGVFPHFKPRRFLADVPQGWALRHQLSNPYSEISISEFFIFEKTTAP